MRTKKLEIEDFIKGIKVGKHTNKPERQYNNCFKKFSRAISFYAALIIIIFAVNVTCFADELREELGALTPVLYDAKEQHNISINDMYFGVKHTDFYLDKLPDKSKINWGGAPYTEDRPLARYAFYQEKETNKINIEGLSEKGIIFGHMTLYDLMIYAGGFILFGCFVLWSKMLVEGDICSIKGHIVMGVITLILGVFPLATGIFFSYKHAHIYVMFDNGGLRTYSIKVGEDKFDLPANTRVSVGLKRGEIHRVIVVDPKTGLSLYKGMISAINTSPPAEHLFFNVNKHNTYYIEKGYYKSAR